MHPITVMASGMVTAVGLDAESSCAAIRCAIDNFTETRFMDLGGEWIIGAQVPLEEPWRGLARLVQMVAPAIRECLDQAGASNPKDIPLLLCVAEKERPGRLAELNEQIIPLVQRQLGLSFHARSGVIPRGRVAGALALGAARELIYEQNAPACIIAGSDSYLAGATLEFYQSQARLLTSQNSNGFIPGEAGAAVLIGRPAPGRNEDLICRGIGTGREAATIQGEMPLRADGLVQAIQAAFADAKAGYQEVDYRLTDANGEQYWFKEAALAMTRTLRVRKELFEIWHPADCVGEIGAASVPCALGIALTAARKKYAPGPGVLCHFGSDDGERSALVLTSPRRTS